MYFAETFGAMHVPQGNMHFLILFNVPSYYPLGECKLSICSFLEYCYTIAVFMNSVLCLSKRCLVRDTNTRKIFSALNLTIVFSTFHSVITQFFQYPFKTNYCFFIKHFVLKTSSLTPFKS